MNAKHSSAFSLFEIGREIHARQGGLPFEVTHLAAATFTADGDGAPGLFQLKRIAEAIAPGTRIKPTTETRSYEHPARTGNVMLGDTVIGRLFEAHPKMLDGRAAVLDLDLDALLRQRAPTAKYTPIRRFPSSAFDLSMIAPRRELSGDLEARASRVCRTAARKHRLSARVYGPAGSRRSEERLLPVHIGGRKTAHFLPTKSIRARAHHCANARIGI